ncbi:DCC1-like thiol-disulfide oxidoreductase family protein [Octadecabacter sp.]|nr:DCC1-like thiol-disulfide oxidoreductase family protein [Octadecabacter sp.]
MTALVAKDNLKTVVIFDTNCILCSAWVRFLRRHERSDTLQFASSRKDVGIRLAQGHGISPKALDLTYLVIRDGKALTKSDASLALLAELKVPWRYLTVFRSVPKRLRDWIYDIVARNRLNWFGEEQDCFLATPAQRSKFLDDLPSHGQPTQRAE